MSGHAHNFVAVGPEGPQGAAGVAAAAAYAAGSVKIHVTLPTGSNPAGEYLWATPQSTGTFRIDNIPFYDVGFTMGALVRATPINERVFEFVRVEDPGEWRQVWFGTTDAHGGPALDAIIALHVEGPRWKYEAMHTCSFVAVANGLDALEELKDTLSELCANEIVAFYWDDKGEGEMTDAMAAEMGVE